MAYRWIPSMRVACALRDVCTYIGAHGRVRGHAGASAGVRGRGR